MNAPKLYCHGTLTCQCLEGEGVTVVDRTDSGLVLRFDGDSAEWALGWPAYFSGRFVQFDSADLEPAPWLG